jgi:LacI family transcriptional regulator
MSKRKVTIIDIAKKLGLSKSTVSRALKDHPRISEETIKKVKTLAKRLNFEPNSLAIGLFTKRSNAIGVIVPEIVNHFFAAVIDGIEDVADKSGYRIIICKSNESYEREVSCTAALVSQHVDGLLVALSSETKKIDHFAAVHKRGIPLVFFDRVTEKLDVSKVLVDDLNGAFTATEFLIHSGYKKIAHLAGPALLKLGRQRKNGYLKALKKYNVPLISEYVIEGGMNFTSGYSGTQELLKLNNLPDSIFAANDQIAMGAMRAIKEHKLRIPEDIALIGFSNEPITMITEPTLTTIHQPSFEMGQIACKLLIEEIGAKKKRKPAQTIILKTTLHKRSST